MLGKWTWHEQKCFKDHSKGFFTFSPLNLILSVDNRPSISAKTERKQKPRNGSCSNQKHNCITLQPLGEGKKLVAEEDKLLEDVNGTKVVLLGVSGVVSPGASAPVPSELLSRTRLPLFPWPI